MLENVTIAVNGKVQQFLGLLLFQHTHLLFKHLAMQSLLPLMLDAFEFDTLGTTTTQLSCMRQQGNTHSCKFGYIRAQPCRLKKIAL